MAFYQTPFLLFKTFLWLCGPLKGFFPVRPGSLPYAFLLLPFAGLAQSRERLRIDSLTSLLPKTGDDTGKVLLLNTISIAWFPIDPNSGIRYGEQSLLLAGKLHWEKGMAGGYNALGSNYWAKNDYLRAQDYYLQALKINEALADKYEMARNLHNLGVIHESVNDYSKAIEFYERALALDKEIDNKPRSAGCLSNIGEIYEHKKNYPEALHYYIEALHMTEAACDQRDIAFMQARVGLAYADMGNYVTALNYKKMALSTFERLEEREDYRDQIAEIGGVYEAMHDHRTALSYYHTALQMALKLKSHTAFGNEGRYYGAIGGVYLQMAADSVNRRALLRLAAANFQRSILASGTANDPGQLTASLKGLSEVYEQQGNFAAALKTFKQYSLSKDSVDNFEKDKEISRRDLEFEYSLQTDSLKNLKKLQKAELLALDEQQALARLTVKQNWLYAIIIIVAFSLVGSYLLFRNRIQRLRLRNELTREKAEKERITFSALRSQMNPHFIFNALNTIQSYVYANDKKSASNYLGKFSELIRKTLDHSNKQSISLEEEIELLQLYLEIEKARFGDKLDAGIHTEKGLHMEDIFIPPMLIQPYVENAVKHGLLHRTEEKKLAISVQRSEDRHYLEIVIDDNGIGREKSAEINQKRMGHQSFANMANEKRIELFNQLQDKKAVLEIIDKKNGDGSAAGTTVTIRLPVSTVPAP